MRRNILTPVLFLMFVSACTEAPAPRGAPQDHLEQPPGDAVGDRSSTEMRDLEEARLKLSACGGTQGLVEAKHLGVVIEVELAECEVEIASISRALEEAATSADMADWDEESKRRHAGWRAGMEEDLERIRVASAALLDARNLLPPSARTESGTEVAREILGRYDCTRDVAAADDITAAIDRAISACDLALRDNTERNTEADKDKQELMKRKEQLEDEMSAAMVRFRDPNLRRSAEVDPKLEQAFGQVQALAEQQVELYKKIVSVETRLGKLNYQRVNTKKRLRILTAARRAAVPASP